MEHPRIYAGVDTHSDTHTLALIDEYGRPLATQTFMADPTGYERLAAMIGDPDACLGIGVEGTNSYGAAPARRLVEAGYDVHEVLRPKRAVRRRDGKSDPVDALAAARSVLAGDGTSVPKSADGWVEALRAPDAERAQLVTATAALSDSAKGLPATAPEHIRERYRGSRTPTRMRRLAACRPSGNTVEQGMLVALKASGKAWKALKEQADLLEKNMRLILEEHARPLPGHLLRQHGDRRDPGHRRRGQPRTHPQRGRVRPGSAAPAPSPPPAARPTGTGSTKAATGRATPPCTTSPSSACATTSPPATT